jgi:23S rRNA (uracil1939-C5)-methyltransferase
MIQKKSQVLELSIESLSHEGKGVARHKGKVIFVEDAVPGDVLNADIDSSKRKMAMAHNVGLITVSEHRCEAKCRYFQQCGGCTQQHIDVDTQIEFKQKNLHQQLQRETSQILDSEIWQAPLVAEQWFYRHRIRMQRKGEALGFFQSKTNRLIDVSECLVIDQRLNDLLPPVRKLMKSISKRCTEVVLDVDSTGNLALMLVAKQPLQAGELESIKESDIAKTVSVFVHNGKTLQFSYPENAKALNITLNDVTINYWPWHFSQAHLKLNQQMIEQAISWLNIQKDDTVFDLFSGVGNFSLPLARACKKVVAIEGLDELTEQAQSNAMLNNLANTEFFTANLFEAKRWAERLSGSEKLVIDPPRAGALFLCEQIVKTKVKEVLYVSCNPATLARDSAVMLAAGFEIKKACVMDMFAHSNHIESMILFSRS